MIRFHGIYAEDQFVQMLRSPNLSARPHISPLSLKPDTQPLLAAQRTHTEVSFISLNSNLRKRNCPVWYSKVAPSSVYNWPLALPW